MTFPARGTWIEIVAKTSWKTIITDVPRKGNVDRNSSGRPRERYPAVTFPARGTWIEIRIPLDVSTLQNDVPRKGNVDRNGLGGQILVPECRRSPQGERG